MADRSGAAASFLHLGWGMLTGKLEKSQSQVAHHKKRKGN